MQTHIDFKKTDEFTSEKNSLKKKVTRWGYLSEYYINHFKSMSNNNKFMSVVGHKLFQLFKSQLQKWRDFKSKARRNLYAN